MTASRPLCTITCVCSSSPVTMFPEVLKAGVCTRCDSWHKSSTSLEQTPDWITAAMRSFVPSERYDSAQQASVNTSTSVQFKRVANVESAGATHSSGGGGLALHKFDRVHVAFLISETLFVSTTSFMIGANPPDWRTKSRKFAQSPAMFPSAHTACSRTSSSGDCKSSTKSGKAPCSTTMRVWSAVPEAMLVSTQAASNWSLGCPTSLRSCTTRGTIPALMTSTMGGFLSTDSIFRNCCVALKTASKESEFKAWTMPGNASKTSGLGPSPSSMLEPPLVLNGCGPTPPGTSSVIRFFCNASSLVCLRSWMAASSRFLRASSASAAFLKPFCR
mmetsp:Transcript_126875/g.364924  ORF Transcript_126875/g.364924 Transcript_126875/m.364924 type:complete len:332 (-) Transcript_126875:103-1098(-)